MTPLTVDALVELALGRVGEWGALYPSARAPMYRRVGIRQRQLFIHAAKTNPDYYGFDLVVALTADKTIDLTGLTPVPELVQRIEIADPGSSAWAVGTAVTPVSVTDLGGDFPPRVVVRGQSLAQVGTDLAGVTSLRLWCSELPAAIPGSSDGTTALRLDAPWDGILEADLAQWVLAKSTGVPPDTMQAAMGLLASDEQELMREFTAHLVTIAPTVQRYLSPLSRPSGVL